MRAGTSTVQIKAKDTTGPTPGMVINRRQTSLSRASRRTLRCSLANFSRKTRRAASKGSIISASSGTPSTRSWIRCSKPTTPTIPTFSPKLRNKPRISFSIARAFSWSIFRAARSALRFWLASVLTCTVGISRLDYLRGPARVVAIAFVDLRLEKRLRVSRFDADRRDSCFRQSTEQPLRQRPSLETATLKPPCVIAKNSEKVFGVTYHLHFTANPARLVDDAYGRFFDRHVQSGIVFHAALLP